MSKKLNKKQILKKGGIAALKLRIKEELSKEIELQYHLTNKKIKALQEQAQGTLYKIAVGGCTKCLPGSSIHECPYSDGSCTQSIKNEMDIATGKKKPVTIVGTESSKLNDIKNTIKKSLEELKTITLNEKKVRSSIQPVKGVTRCLCTFPNGIQLALGSTLNAAQCQQACNMKWQSMGGGTGKKTPDTGDIRYNDDMMDIDLGQGDGTVDPMRGINIKPMGMKNMRMNEIKKSIFKSIKKLNNK